jgi:hypothetical protein
MTGDHLPMTTMAQKPATQFPYFQYTSLLGTHTLLLAFTAVFLPGGTVLITPLPPQQSSLDKPQHRLLEPITANPVWTLLWLCAGTGACQAWWAGWMRQFWAAYPHRKGGFVAGKDTGGDIEVVARGAQGKIQACLSPKSIFQSAETMIHRPWGTRGQIRS